MTGLINLTEIPGAGLRPDLVDAAAPEILKIGGEVGTQAGTVLSTWQGIASVYEAPEDDVLFGVMDPVATNGETYESNLLRLSAALRSYAVEMEPVKAELDRIRTDAENFLQSITGGVEQRHGNLPYGNVVEWHQDQPSVDANNALVARLDAAQLEKWRIERDCANAIRAIAGLPPVGAASVDNPYGGWGFTEIPDGVTMPWGSAVERQETCAEGIGNRALYEAVVLNIVWGGIQSTAALGGVNLQTWELFDGELARSAWAGLGRLGVGLVTVANPALWDVAQLPGPVGDFFRDGLGTLVAVGKGQIAYDKWGTDPAVAVAETAFNLTTLLVPGGAAYSAVRGGTALPRLNRALKVDVPGAVTNVAILAGGRLAPVVGRLTPTVADFLRTHDFADLSATIAQLRATSPNGVVIETPRGEGDVAVPVRPVPNAGETFVPPSTVAELTWRRGGTAEQGFALERHDGTLTGVVLHRTASGEVQVRALILDRTFAVRSDGSVVEVELGQDGQHAVDPGSSEHAGTAPSDAAPVGPSVGTTAAQERSVRLFEALARGAVRPAATGVWLEAVKDGVNQLNEARAAGKALRLEELSAEFREALLNLPPDILIDLVDEGVVADAVLERVPAGG